MTKVIERVKSYFDVDFESDEGVEATTIVLGILLALGLAAVIKIFIFDRLSNTAEGIGGNIDDSNNWQVENQP